MYPLPGLILACLLLSAPCAMAMTLPEAVQLALENNLQIQASDQGVQAEGALRDGARGVYDPEFNGTLSLNDSQSSDSSNIFFSDDRTVDASLALTQRFSPGTSVTVSLGQDRLGSSGGSSTFQSDLGLVVQQPLLRNYGRLATERALERAGLSTALAVQDRETLAAQVIQAVHNSWYEVLRLQQDLELREASIALARQLEEENRARVEAGNLAEVELLSAQVGLQLRLQQEREVQRQLDDERDRLSLLLQQAVPSPLQARLPESAQFPLDRKTGLELAKQTRPELRRTQVVIDQAQLETDLALNQQRPELNLVGAYNRNVFDDGFDNSLDAFSDEDTRSWTIGLNLNYPFGNRQRTGETVAAKYRLQQARTLHQQTIEEIRREIEQAARLLQTRRTQLKQLTLESRLAQQRVDILLQRQQVGLATVTDVLDGEEDLTDARTREFQALADVQTAWTAYRFATGALLVEARKLLSVDRSSQPRTAQMAGE